MAKSGYSLNVKSIGTLTAGEAIPAARFVKLDTTVEDNSVYIATDTAGDDLNALGVSNYAVGVGGTASVAYSGVVEVDAVAKGGVWPKAGNRVTSDALGKASVGDANTGAWLGFALTSASAAGDRIAVLLQKHVA